MTAALVQFVDYMVGSPTVLLDINDETSWWVNSFDAPPPRLRRSVANNAMRDGGYVSSASYDMRVLSIGLDLRTASQDTWATEFQKLARILDGASSILKYQPNGASKPVFFKVSRSDVSSLYDQLASAAFRKATVDLLAEPFAYGLLETATTSIGFDPHSSGCFYDFTPLGDAPTPLILQDMSQARHSGMVSVRSAGTSWTFFHQAESCTLGTDTTNPGGAADAAMSGNGTTNYRRTSFATVSGMVARITTPAISGTGRYHVVAGLRRSDNTSAIRVQRGAAYTGDVPAAAVTTALTTSRQYVYLGILPLDGPTGSTMASSGLPLQAARDSGAGTLDWDLVFLIPADERSMFWTGLSESPSTATTIINGETETAFWWDSGGKFQPNYIGQVSGGFPVVVPGKTNRVYLLRWESTGVSTLPGGDSWSVSYYPKYLMVRPSAT